MHQAVPTDASSPRIATFCLPALLVALSSLCTADQSLARGTNDAPRPCASSPNSATHQEHPAGAASCSTRSARSRPLREEYHAEAAARMAAAWLDLPLETPDPPDPCRQPTKARGAQPQVIYPDGVQPENLESSTCSSHRLIGQSSGADPEVRLTFYHLDHLGTPRVITDVNGQPISTHKYLPFGEELDPQPSLNTHRFTGHERDTETGLDYMLARYYGNASTFRFLSTDPADASIISEDPQTWNRYTYANNNPLIMVDEDGESATLVGAGVGALVGGGAALLQGKSWREVGAAAAGGAVAGAMLGSVIDTGGASLGVMVAAGALSGAAGGITENAINGEPVTVQGVAMDAAAGGTGAMAGAVLGAVVEGAAARAAASGGTSAATESSGTKITGFTKEGIDQTINRGITPGAIADATKNPLQQVTKTDAAGRVSTQNIGRQATVVTNPEGKVVTTWQTSTKRVQKLEKQ